MMVKSNTFLVGMDGELEVRRILNNMEGIKYIENLYLPTVRGTCQIDFIVISKSGIYVVEVKNINGTIVVDENNTVWKIRNISSSYTIINPVLQNSRHILNLRKTIGLEGKYVNTVVFPEKANIIGHSDSVTTFSGLYAIQTNKREVFSKEDIDTVYNHLTKLKDANRKLSIKHNKNTKRFRK